MGAREKNGARKSVIFIDLHNFPFLLARARLRGKKDDRSQCRVDGLKSQSGTFSKGNTNVYKHINFVFLALNE